jgi:FAD/FMN-containing dehydrogenase
MRACTSDGREVDLPQATVDTLKLRHRGPVIAPGEAGYEESRSLWNAMIDRRPALVARCLGTTDVMAGVAFAREYDLLLCIKSGGHNIAGLAVADGALMLDLSLMRGVWVDAARRIAHAQGGCVLGDVDRETQLHGLAATLGFVSLTGIAGLTLGGGFGYLTRRWGWTADTVLGMDLVTAEGRPVRASADEHPDLFWALRGGGGNFGVVTGIDYALQPVGPEIVGGIVAWPADEAPRVLEVFRAFAEQAPPELTLVAMMRNAPPAPWLPAEWHRRPIVAVLACHSGPVGEGERAVAPIKALGRPIGDVLVRRPYVQLQSLLDGTQPKGRRYYWKSEYLPSLDAEACERMMAHAARNPSPHSAVAGSWDQAAHDETNLAWVRQTWEDMKRFSTGGTYINFLAHDEGPERTRAALGPAVQRLAEVKARWDPQNVFRTNRNIAPARAS